MNRINEAKKFGWKLYCTLQCQYIAREKRVSIRCSNPTCTETFKRAPGDMRSLEMYCSRSCTATVNNVRFPKRIAKQGTCGSCGIDIKGSKQYCSKACKWQGQVIAKEELLHWIHDFRAKHHRTPLKRECPHYRTIRDWFGTWNKAIVAAGLKPNPVLFAEQQVAKDGHLCDSIAEKLIDDWLTEHAIPHDRKVPYPDKKHTADFRVGKTLIEFFGLTGALKVYDKHVKIKKKLARQNHLHLLKIYPKDMYPTTKLDALLSSALLQTNR